MTSETKMMDGEKVVPYTSAVALDLTAYAMSRAEVISEIDGSDRRCAMACVSKAMITVGVTAFCANADIDSKDAKALNVMVLDLLIDAIQARAAKGEKPNA